MPRKATGNRRMGSDSIFSGPQFLEKCKIKQRPQPDKVEDRVLFEESGSGTKEADKRFLDWHRDCIFNRSSITG